MVFTDKFHCTVQFPIAHNNNTAHQQLIKLFIHKMQDLNRNSFMGMLHHIGKNLVLNKNFRHFLHNNFAYYTPENYFHYNLHYNFDSLMVVLTYRKNLLRYFHHFFDRSLLSFDFHYILTTGMFHYIVCIYSQFLENSPDH